jgi:HSF-type DNA-binding
MISACDPSIASWSAAGDCFTVKDIETFEKEVVPKYFNHSNFSSFTRQLNFYGFQKMRSDADLQVNSNNSVRFCHEYFKQGQPELLMKIKRATATSTTTTPSSPLSSRAPSPSLTAAGTAGPAVGMDDVSSEHVEALARQVQKLNQELNNLTNLVDQKLVHVANALQQDYQRRVLEMDDRYRRLLASVMLPPSFPSSSLIGAGLNYNVITKRQRSE